MSIGANYQEGKIIGLPGNRRVGMDVIAGVFYIVGSDRRGNLVSLSQQQIEAYKTRFWEPESLSEQDVDHALFMRFFAL